MIPFKNSLFYRYLAMAVSIVLCVMFIFYLYLWKANLDSVWENYYASKKEFISYCGSSITSTVSNVLSVSFSCFYSSDVIMNMFTRTAMDYDNILECVNALATTVGNFDEISYMSFYVEKKNAVFESNKSLHSFAECSQREDI